MKGLNRLGTGLGVLLILAWCLLPVVWIVSLSFKSQEAVTNGSPGFLPFGDEWTGLDNYKQVLQDGDFLLAIRNSLVVSLSATILSVIVATLAAYAIARLEFAGKKFVLTTALVIAMFPVVSLVGPLFDVWRTIGLYDTWYGLIIPYISFTLPLAAPGVFTAAILTFFFAWNDFVFGISLTSTERARPIPAALSFFVGADPFNRPASLLAAGTVVATIPIVIIVLVFQRKIVAGLTAGAVKG